MNVRSALAILLVVIATLVGAMGLFILVTERGVANEIKGIVLILISVVLLVGGCVLWELGAIRRALEQRADRQA